MNRFARPLVLLLLVIVGTHASDAQETSPRKLRLGVMLGPNLSSRAKPASLTFAEIHPKLGYDLQFSAVQPLSNRFALQAALGTSRLVYKINEVDFTSSALPNNRRTEATYCEQAFLLAAWVRYSFSRRQEKIFATFGPELEKILRGKTTYINYDNSTVLSKGEYPATISPMALTFQASAGYRLMLGPSISCTLEAYFKYHHFNGFAYFWYPWHRLSTGIRVGFWL